MFISSLNKKPFIPNVHFNLLNPNSSLIVEDFTRWGQSSKWYWVTVAENCLSYIICILMVTMAAYKVVVNLCHFDDKTPNHKSRIMFMFWYQSNLIKIFNNSSITWEWNTYLTFEWNVNYQGSILTRNFPYCCVPLLGQ